MVNVLLTLAAFAWLYRRSIVELAGLGFLVAAAWLLHPLLGVACAGIALILAANFSGRAQ